MLPVRVEHRIDPPHEHPGIPVMAAGGDHTLRRITLGFLDEALHGEHVEGGLELKTLARLDVTEAGIGSRRRDAESDEVAALGGGRRGNKDLPEGRALL